MTSAQLTQAAPSQCVRLPRPCLSVTENGGIVTVEQRLHHRLDAGLVYLVLAGCRSKCVVEGVKPVGTEHHLRRARHHPHTHLVVLEDFPGEQGSNTDRHPDTHLAHNEEMRLHDS